MKGFISFIALIAALSPVMPAYAADIPAKTPPIAESGFEITEVVPPTLPYVSGGNFFGMAHGFNDGLAIVSTDEPIRGYFINPDWTRNYGVPQHYGVIDTSGNVILKPEYSSITITDEYICAHPYDSPNSEDRHYFDRTGKLLLEDIRTSFDETGNLVFNDKRMSIRDGLIKYQAKDEDGKTVTKFRYINGNDATTKTFNNDPGDFYKGYSIIDNGLRTPETFKMGMMDKSFNIVVPIKFAWIKYGPSFGIGGSFDSYGLIPASEVLDSFGQGSFGFIDNTGEFIIEPKFSDARPFSEGLAAVVDKGTKKMGYIDTSGNYVIQPTINDFPSIRTDFNSGLAYISGLGYIDKTGKVVIFEDFLKKNYESYGRPFKDGFAVVITDLVLEKSRYSYMTNITFGLIDKTGKLLPLDKYDNVYYYGSSYPLLDPLYNFKNGSDPVTDMNGYAVVEKNGKVGIIRVKPLDGTTEDEAKPLQ